MDEVDTHGEYDRKFKRFWSWIRVYDEPWKCSRCQTHYKEWQMECSVCHSVRLIGRRI